MRPPARPAASRVLGTILGLLSVVMLVATVWLGSLVVQQTRALQSSVAFTQDVVDANVRTLAQVQREVLRLQVLLATPGTDRAALDLAQSLVDQRVQEGSLPYQGQTLGSTELLDRSRALARRWTEEVRPTVTAALADPAGATTTAAAGLTALERDYNQLVSDGEINRKNRAGQANGETRQLLDRARSLLVGLGVSVTAFLVFLGLTGVAFGRMHRTRERAAEALRAANDELRTHALVVHNTDNLVVITDPEGRVEWVNDAFVRRTGHTLDDLLGRRPGSVLQGPLTDCATVAHMAAALARGEGFTVEVANYTRGGEAYWVGIEAHPVRDDADRLTHFIAIETDVTERRRTEETLRAASETALGLAQEKAGFLATMSHEIRTPLNAVLGVTALLAGTHLDAEQAEYVATAQRSGTLLLSLVNDILDYSALDSGTVEPERRPFDVRALVADVQDVLATDAATRGLDLTHRVEAGVPAQVVGDETRLRQVLLNLVGNGLKFTPSGEVSVAVRTLDGPDEHTARLQLTVRDTGIGIPVGRQERIFLPFTQVDASTTRRYGGTGLGLSICRRTVDNLGGTLELHSEPGSGSEFTVTVPVGLVPRAVERPAPAQDEPPACPAGLRVLVAEDEAVNRMVALRMLSRLGVEAAVAEDGVAAVTAVRDGLDTGCPVDLVLMDVHMPHLDGVAATAQIRTLDGVQPAVVALTATALDGDRERLLAAGMDDYLSKPVTLAALQGLLGRVAAERTARCACH